MFFIFLLSGLFLGWSLGANDAANAYGTAVGTGMIRFRTAAAVCAACVVLGAVISGAGPARTLSELGAVNTLPGAFTVALGAGLTVTWMSRLGLPVSTSQAIVGAIIGWNVFSGSPTGTMVLMKIVGSWVLCPLLTIACTIVLYRLTQLLLRHSRVHLFRIDAATRHGLFVAGALASYGLGANNIGNVMGVFVPAAPVKDLEIFGCFTLSGPQQLFFLGGAAIALGVITYSKRVMLTVGSDLFRMSPVAALIVVVAQGVVLFLFSSEWLEQWLAANGLPALPLVPVSSSQAVVAAVVGIGIAKGGRNLHLGLLGRVFWGWVATPVVAGLASFLLLFFVQNVFLQEVFSPVSLEISPAVPKKVDGTGPRRPRIVSGEIRLDVLLHDRGRLPPLLDAEVFADAIGSKVTRATENGASGVVGRTASI